MSVVWSMDAVQAVSKAERAPDAKTLEVLAQPDSSRPGKAPGRLLELRRDPARRTLITCAACLFLSPIRDIDLSLRVYCHSTWGSIPSIHRDE